MQLSASPRRSESSRTNPSLFTSSAALSPSRGTFLDIDDDPAASTFQDSPVSTVDDPFFASYTAAPTEPLLPPNPSPGIPGHRNAPRQPWPPPRKESLTNLNLTTPWVRYFPKTIFPPTPISFCWLQSLSSPSSPLLPSTTPTAAAAAVLIAPYPFRSILLTPLLCPFVRLRAQRQWKRST